MKNLKFLQKLLIFLFVGFSMCVLQACSNEDEPIPGNKENNKTETLTLFKRWYLTDFSGDIILDWESDDVIGHREYMEFTKNTLYWNNRLGGENSTYKFSGIINGYIGSSFTAININDPEDSRIFTIKKMTKTHLLLYDQYEEMYSSFVTSSYAKFGDNGGNGSSNGDYNEEEEEEEEEEEGEWRDCYACNGTGICYNCHGDGKGAAIYGRDEYEDCETCDGDGQCPTCDGTGQVWKKKR